MNIKRLEVKVGLFVFIGLLLIAALLIAFSKGRSLFHGYYELQLHAPNVTGLKMRADVLLAGVEAGFVSSIQLAPDGTNVTVILKIYNSKKIYHDANFSIEDSGFLGDKIVEITPTLNQPPTLNDGEDVYCTAPFNFQQVAGSVAGIMPDVDQAVKEIEASVEDLRRTVLSAQSLTNLTIAMANLRSLTDPSTGTVSRINGLIGEANGILATNSEGIHAAVTNIDGATETLREIADDVGQGKGAAGALLQNEQEAARIKDMVNSLNVTANNLAVASSNLNRLGLWKFLWHHEITPARTNAPPSTNVSPRETEQP